MTESTEVKNSDSTNKPKPTGKTKSKTMKRPKQMYPIVEIWWDDPTALTHGWLDDSELGKLHPALVLSIGFLIRDEPNYIVYASDLDASGNHNGRTQINRGVIKNIRVIRKADPIKPV